MKCRLPRAWDQLPKKDKDTISRVCTEMMNEELKKDIQTVQEVMIKLGCIILDEMGLDELEKIKYVVKWTRAYRRLAREQLLNAEWLNEQMVRCFPVHGFPQERIDNMKD